MLLRGCLSALTVCGFLLVAAPGYAAPPNGCLGLYDPVERGDTEDVYVSVERSDETAVCFLIPREVVPERFRSIYSHDIAAPLLLFEPRSLLAYLDGKQSVMVGAEQRSIDPGKHDCLAQLALDSIQIASGFETEPITIGTISTFSKEAASDLPGYRRLTTEIQDYYIAEGHADSPVPVACWRSQHPDLCFMLGDYDKTTIALRFQKSELARISPAKTLQCVRDIADLFRVTKPVEAE